MPAESPDRSWDRSAMASSFGSVAAAYSAYRPGYPAAAVAVAVPGPAARVLDLGAGTGKLTAALAAPGRTVHAVEPDTAMLAELRAALPSVIAAEGSAESIPLPDASVDAVVVGQAWHWFDPDPARAEIARVLRPGGTLALLWNVDDRSDELTAAVCEVLDRLVRPPGGASGRERPLPPFEAGNRLTAPELHTVPAPWTVSVLHLHAVEDTKSYMILADPARRAQVHRELDEVLVRFGSPDPVTLAQKCQVWTARRG
jgi:SAM-dependent methyltransferase